MTIARYYLKTSLYGARRLLFSMISISRERSVMSRFMSAHDTSAVIDLCSLVSASTSGTGSHIMSIDLLLLVLLIVSHLMSLDLLSLVLACFSQFFRYR